MMSRRAAQVLCALSFGAILSFNSFAWAAGPAGGPIVTANQLPSGGSVSAGSATMAVQGNVLTVTNSAGAVINWQDFSIGSNARATFVQPSASSAVLNRVIGGNPSSIMGALQSNGRVFVTNPNGMLISSGATINTAGFTATTSETSNSDFVAGRTDWSGIGSLFSTAGQISGSTIRISGNAIEVGDFTAGAAAAVTLASAGTMTLTGGNIGTGTLQVTQTTQRAALDWQQFSVGTAGTVTFNSPSSTAVSLNRVVGSNVTTIAGSLQSNGSVSLINPTASAFGASTNVTLVQTSLTAPSSVGALTFTGGTISLGASMTGSVSRGAVSLSSAGATTLTSTGSATLGSGNVTITGATVGSVGSTPNQSVGAAAGSSVAVTAAASAAPVTRSPAPATPAARLALQKREPIY
jgi:filamentous hemagglutinin family protein